MRFVVTLILFLLPFQDDNLQMCLFPPSIHYFKSGRRAIIHTEFRTDFRKVRVPHKVLRAEPVVQLGELRQGHRSPELIQIKGSRIS